MSLTAIRAAITAQGVTPQSFAYIDALRELVTALGGTPTQFSVIGLLREAIAAKGGTPTQFATMPLLRELLAACGVTPGPFSDLWGQLASIPHATAVNIVDPAGWGNPSLGTVSTDGAGNIRFIASGNGVNISEVPLAVVKPTTLYDWFGDWSGTGNKISLFIGGSYQAILFPNGASSGQFTTPASLGDGRLYIQRVGVGSVSGVLANTFSVIEH